MERLFAAAVYAERGRFMVILSASTAGRLVLFLPAFMAAGVVAYFSQPTEPAHWPQALLAMAAIGLAILVRGRPPAFAAALCLCAVIAGFGSASFATWRAPAWNRLPRSGVDVIGAIGLLESLPAGRRVTLLAPSLDGAAPLTRRVRIRLRDTDTQKLAPGDRIRVRALLRQPSPPDYPGGWDTQRDAYFARIAGFGFAIRAAERLSPVPSETGFPPSLQQIRSRIATRILGDLPGERGAIAATLLTGIGTAIPPADRTAFQNSGLAHLLAVAGLHVGIVIGLVFGATRLALAACERTALYWPTRQVAAVAALAAGAAYLALTGAHVPLIRSFVMACLVTIGVLTGRRAVSIRALALAATGLMLAAPQEVMGVSFQMSFSAVAALIAGYEALRPAMARIGPGTPWRTPALHVAGLILTSLLAGTASLPFAAYHFGRATLWFVPANLLAVPITAFWVLPLGVASLLLMPFGLAQAALLPMGWGIGWLIVIAQHVAAWPGASIAVPQMPGWGLASIAAGLIVLTIMRSRLRLAGTLPIMLGLASPLLVQPPDIVVGADAGIIAMLIDGRVLVERQSRVSAFEQQMPERVWGAPASAGFDCVGPTCTLAIRGATIMLVRNPSSVACTGVALLVAAVPLRGICDGVQRIDRFTVLHDGATAVWQRPYGIDMLTDRQARGARPWVIGAITALPKARSE